MPVSGNGRFAGMEIKRRICSGIRLQQGRGMDIKGEQL